MVIALLSTTGRKRLMPAISAIVVVLLTCLASFANADDDQTTLDSIKDVWRKRQDATKSLLVAWKQEFVFHKSMLTLNKKVAERYKDSPDYLSTEMTSEARLSGDRFDYRDNRPNGGDFSMPPMTRTSYDGDSYYDLGIFSSNDPTGIRSKKTDRFQRRNTNSAAIMLAFRPMSKAFSQFTISNSTSIKSRESYEKIPCVVLDSLDSGSNQKLGLWVDTERFLPRRFTKHNGGVLRFELSIQYADSPPDQLTAWSSTYYKEDGTPDEIIKAVVTNFEKNANIPISDFQISWPPGTLVIDETTGTRMRLPGGKKENTPSETATSRSSWLIWINGILLVGFVVFIVLRRRSAKSKLGS